MSFQYLTNVPLEKAKEDYIALLESQGFGVGAEEVIPVQESCGRITAKAVYAKINAPHYPASAMDGIALLASKTFGATETTPVLLGAEDYVALDTGDPIPEGCDAVVMIEDVINADVQNPSSDAALSASQSANGAQGRIKLYAPAAPWQHIRQVGEDICAHEMIMPSHTEITPASIGSMLAGGVLEVSVLKKPRIGIIPTGDEIVAPTDSPKAGDIIEFNSSIFGSMLTGWGCEVKTYGIVKDKLKLMQAALSEALSECDAVILNAGSSAGRDDYACDAIEAVGSVLFHGIAMKPGKPAILGYNGAKPILGVPGYPVSGILVIEEILKPLIDRWFGRIGSYKTAEAVLSRRVVSGLKYEEFVRVRLGKVGGKLIASPLNRGAGVVSSFMKADGIMRVPQNSEGFEAGDTVSIRLLKAPENLDKTVVVIGSHDPLLDELADLLHSKYPELYMSSTHVGSMGGIMAAKRGENHMGGIHLLSEADGTYNNAFLDKYFPEGGVKLIECVNRVQGIMVAKGNPLGIKGVEDLTRAGLRYVNRQKGSGTRILIDYLCKKNGIDTSKIYGYEREEFTHNSVATQIASGSADAGMGIYSAAQIYGLDFIPICNEQYDLLVPDYAWNEDAVQRIIEILKTDEFRTRLEKLGGYQLGAPGRIRRG